MEQIDIREEYYKRILSSLRMHNFNTSELFMINSIIRSLKLKNYNDAISDIINYEVVNTINDYIKRNNFVKD